MKKYNSIVLLFASLIIISSCKNDKTQKEISSTPDSELKETEALAVTMEGEKLLYWKDHDTVWAARKKKVDDMRIAYLSKIEDPKSYLNFAKAYSEAGKIENAIDILTKGMNKFPDVPDFYLYRGENLLRSRQITESIDDFWKAGQKMEKATLATGLTGMPVEDSIAGMTLSYRNYLLMAIAFHCNQDYSSADKFFEVCGDFSTNSDLWARSYYWQYSCYSRSGRTQDAQDILKNLSENMQILPSSKHYLDALKYYKGSISESNLVDINFKPTNSEEANIWLVKMYAVGVKNLLDNKKDKALIAFTKIKESGYWNTLPYIAAEGELLKLGGKKYVSPEKIDLDNSAKKKEIKPQG
ncbi:MAG: hypothetical protein HOP11_02025 [Saprospiraceae bacterium]|nr:hypothetical protein [Saprospiraceae bacterium]